MFFPRIQPHPLSKSLSFICFFIFFCSVIPITCLLCAPSQPNTGPAATQKTPQLISKKQEEDHKPTKPAPQKDDAQAQYKRALMYHDGRGVGQDLGEAKRLYELAAQKGYSYAQVNLGFMHLDGERTPVDYEKARLLFYEAAQQGHPDAQTALGVIYEEGLGVSENPKKALHFYLSAAKKEQATAQYRLGGLYEEGRGVPKDLPKALRYYKMAADQGHPDAQITLGDMYIKGIGVKKDPAKALKFFTLAAKKNSPTAYYNLGVLYENGIGVSQDLQRAKKFYLLAAKQGEANALYNLGLIYARNVLLLQKDKLENYKKALAYLHLAAQKNHPQAQETALEFVISITKAPSSIEEIEIEEIEKESSDPMNTAKALLINPPIRFFYDFIKEIGSAFALQALSFFRSFSALGVMFESGVWKKN